MTRNKECADGNSDGGDDDDAVLRGENPVDTPLLGIYWNAETVTARRNTTNTDTAARRIIEQQIISSCRIFIVIALIYVSASVQVGKMVDLSVSLLSATAFELLPVEVAIMQFRKNLVKNFIRLTLFYATKFIFWRW